MKLHHFIFALSLSAVALNVQAQTDKIKTPSKAATKPTPSKPAGKTTHTKATTKTTHSKPVEKTTHTKAATKPTSSKPAEKTTHTKAATKPTPSKPAATKSPKLNYKITGPNTCEVAFYYDFLKGHIAIPETARIDGQTYTVTSIAKYGFIGCDKLTAVDIPRTITTIGNGAFNWCKALASINVANDNPVLCSIDGVVYSKDKTTIMRCPPNRKGNYAIPNSVTTIGYEAFQGCEALTSINIPSSVTTIGDGAFSGCQALKSIDIPSSVTTISEYAFHGCENLTSINIPNSVTTIGKEAFWGCSALTTIDIPSSVTAIGSNIFYGCKNLTSINVASDNLSYCSVDGALFAKDKKTLLFYPGGKKGRYNIPSSVTTIGDCAFNGCKTLTSINIPSSVSSIGDLAFSGCKALTSISIPNSVTTIGNDAFWACNALTIVNLPESFINVGNRAFNDCTALTTINCHAKTPPAINDYIPAHVTIHVPQGCAEAYRRIEYLRFCTIVDDL